METVCPAQNFRKSGWCQSPEKRNRARECMDAGR
jgi:hypothetical protein